MAESNFRKMLLSSCKDKFDENFAARKTKDEAKALAAEKGVEFNERDFAEE